MPLACRRPSTTQIGSSARPCREIELLDGVLHECDAAWLEYTLTHRTAIIEDMLEDVVADHQVERLVLELDVGYVSVHLEAGLKSALT